jgi:hypothetical protein
MDFSIPPIPKYAYVFIRLKMSDTTNGIVQGTLLYHYGETNDAFLVGGLVQLGETLMASAIRHCRHLVNFRLAQNDRLYLDKNMYGFMAHERVQITSFVLVLFLADFISGRLVTTLPHWLWLLQTP